VLPRSSCSDLLVARPVRRPGPGTTLAYMDRRLTPSEAAFPFRIVALPSRELHRRVPEIAHADDVVIIDTPQLEDHPGIARSALRYARAEPCVVHAGSGTPSGTPLCPRSDARSGSTARIKRVG